MGSREATLAILAGGQSRRMGAPKALLRLGERTLVETMVTRLGRAFEQVLLCGRPGQEMPPTLADRFVADLHPGSGPLSGIETALATASTNLVMCLACDMPSVTPELVTFMLGLASSHDVLLPVVDGKPQATCAVYRRDLLPLVQGSLRGEVRAVWKALEDWHSSGKADIRRVDQTELACAGFPATLFTNLNTPDDLYLAAPAL